jgi:hypothetical protein
LGGVGEGLRGFGEGEAGGDQVLDADEGVSEQLAAGIISEFPRHPAFRATRA